MVEVHRDDVGRLAEPLLDLAQPARRALEGAREVVVEELDRTIGDAEDLVLPAGAGQGLGDAEVVELQGGHALTHARELPTTGSGAAS